MSAADENPSAPGSEPESQDADLQWLQTLAEPELDLMISLKELAVTQAADPCLARRFHLRTLRALGTVLLEHFKDRLKQTSGELNRLALLRDPPTRGSSAQPEVPRRNHDQTMPNRKRKQVQHGSDEESTPSSKQRKLEREDKNGKAHMRPSDG